MPESLKNYLEDASCAKVGLSTHDDFNVMHRSYDFTPAGFIELQEMVKQYNIAELGLQKLYSILFNEKISKGQRLTNWEVTELSPSQQRYAATDAWACLRIYHRLTDGSFDPELSPYKHEITDEET
jgi:ribonuclease D